MITNGDTTEAKKSVETRKKLNFWARLILSLVIFGAFFILLYLLFKSKIIYFYF